MKMRDVLSEAGLELGALRKHRGRYFDILINKIRDKKPLEVEPRYADQFPDGVIIDPAVIGPMKTAFDNDVEASQRVTNNANEVLVHDARFFKQPLPTTTRGVFVPFGALTKTADFKSGTGINRGSIAEGVLGAALTAKFLAKGKPIDESDVLRILNGMKLESVGKGSNSVQGTYTTKVSHDDGVSDDLRFVLRLSMNDFKPLLAGSAMDPDIKGLIHSAVAYVNSDQEGIDNAIKTILDSKDGNTVDVISDGISGSKSTKADLILRVNGEVIKLISLKALGVKQFGQVSGHRYDNIKNFFDDVFDVDVSKQATQFVDKSDPESVAKNYELITQMYRNEVLPQIEAQLSSGDKGEAQFIEKLTKGIVKHAVGDEDLDLVKFNRGVSGGYKVLKVDSDLLDKMKKTKFKVDIPRDRPTLRILGKTTDPDLIAELGTDDWVPLIQLRSYVQSGSYVRNILEMGDLLEALTEVKPKPQPQPLISPPELRRLKRAAKGRITSPGTRDVRDPSVPDVVALGRRKKPIKQ